MADFLITLFLGPLGVHKFIKGEHVLGFVYLFTFGLFGIGWIIDVISAYNAMVGDVTPAAQIATETPDVTLSLNTSSSRQFVSKPTIKNVSLTGYHTIHAITDTKPNTLYALQKLCFPETKKGSVSGNQILAGCDSILSQCKRIIDDCKELINNTDNPKTFFDRYSLLICTYEQMAEYETYIEIYGYQPLESLEYYYNSMDAYQKKLIDWRYNKAIIKADSLKTESGKKNQYIKAYSELQFYENEMSPLVQEYLKKKFSKKIPVVSIESNS